MSGLLYMRIEIWLLEHDWPTRFPRTYLFWDWVIGSGRDTYGFFMWLKWAMRTRVWVCYECGEINKDLWQGCRNCGFPDK